MQPLLEGFRNITNYGGRIRRKTYWGWVGLGLLSLLFVFLCNIALFFVFLPLALLMLPCTIVFLVALAVADIAMQARRLHDVGQSGWMQLLSYVLPFVGWLILLFFLLQDSQPHENAYGPDPKQQERTIA